MLILISNSAVQNYSLLQATVIIGLPLSILAIIFLLARFLLTGTQFVFAETQKEQFTFLRLTNISTISILGIVACATLCSVGFTMKNKNTVAYIAATLILVVLFVLILILLIAPEGFLLIETAVYPRDLMLRQVLLIGIIVAALPCIAALSAQHLLRRWALD